MSHHKSPITDQPASSHLTAGSVQALLSTRTFGRTLHLLDETTSTNVAALALAHDGAAHGTVVAAETQTAGRGRLGRQWHSPAGENLYCSVILRRLPTDERSHGLCWIPLVSAVAAARAIEVVSGLTPALKWPNDLLLSERKVGGILCESGGLGPNGSANQHGIVIVGIGLNVNTSRGGFPEHLREIATSLAIEAGRQFDRAALLASLLNALEDRYELLLTDRATDAENEYRRLCATLGRRVRVELAGGERVEGRADALLEDGSLRVIRDDPRNAVAEVRAADVVHLR